MPEIIQLTRRWFVGCPVSSRLLVWMVLLIVSSETSLKRVRKAFTSLWSRVPWKPTVSILRLYKSSRRLPSRLRYSFKPSDTESSCSWSGTVSFWERVSTLRSSIQKRGLTFRSEITGSGVVVDDDLGEGVTVFGTQPVLRAAVSLKKINIFV